MFVVDTNILVYAADGDSPAHQRCNELIDQWANEATLWCSTWPILYEFMRIATHPRVFRSPWSTLRTWSYVEELLNADGFSMLSPTERHHDFAARTFRELPHLAGNILHDTHTAVLMREHGIRTIYTHDTDFHRFPFLEIIDPLVN